jgi:hypothetical protein
MHYFTNTNIFLSLLPLLQRASASFVDGVQALSWVVDGLTEEGLTQQAVNSMDDAYCNLKNAAKENAQILKAIKYD